MSWPHSMKTPIIWFATSLHLVLNHCWLVLGYLMKITHSQRIWERWNGLIVLFQWNLYSVASAKQCPGWLICCLLSLVVSECQFLTVNTLKWDCLLVIICSSGQGTLTICQNWLARLANLQLQGISAAELRFVCGQIDCSSRMISLVMSTSLVSAELMHYIKFCGEANPASQFWHMVGTLELWLVALCSSFALSTTLQ